MVGESLMIGYVLLGCGVVGAVLATVQAVRAKLRADHDNRSSR
ncbi:hypothetical protein OED01_02570 [Microbacterium sp. M28]|nr:hypothetical protein [Microbacterium sp. M28]UYO97637.1 hypothetical protein OED01_02570 [Microbacterium sp. M28]